MGSFSRWFSKVRKKNKDESPGNPLFKAFNSTPTLDRFASSSGRLDGQEQSNLTRTAELSTSRATTAGQPGQQFKETRTARVRLDLRERDPERWKQQLLAWRLSVYEDARKWEMIDAETHKILRHHAFLSPEKPDTRETPTIRPSQSAPARSQSFPHSPGHARSPIDPSSSPRKRAPAANPLPPSSWSRPAPFQIKSESDLKGSPPQPSPTWGSFLSIPSSPPRSRLKFGQSKSVTSLSIGSSSARGDPPSLLKKERKRDSLRSPFASRPLDLNNPENGDTGTSLETDLEMLSRTKRGILTDDSPAGLIRTEWTRSRAEMKIVCAQGGLSGVVGRAEKEVEGWVVKYGVEMVLQDAQGDTEQELRLVRDIITEISGHEAGPLTSSSSNFLEVPTTPNRKRASVESLETVIPTANTQASTGSFLTTTRGLHNKPSFISLDVPSPDTSPSKSPGKPRRTPSHLSSRSVQSIYSDLSRKATNLSLLGSRGAVKVSRPITPVESIINRNAEIGPARLRTQDQPGSPLPAVSGGVSNLLLLADVRKLEVALIKLARERDRLKRVRLGYQDRVDLLEVKMNGAELRDRLGR